MYEMASSLSLRTVAGRDDSSVLGGTRHAVEHVEGCEAHFADRLFAIALIMEIGRHDTENVGTVFEEDHARVVAYAFEFTGLVRDSEVGGKVARNRTLFVCAENGEEIVRHFLV